MWKSRTWHQARRRRAGDDGAVDLSWTVDGRRYVASLTPGELPAVHEALRRSALKSERDGLVRVDLVATFEQAIGRNPFRERPARRISGPRMPRRSTV
jgi:hypothetical protein